MHQDFELLFMMTQGSMHSVLCRREKETFKEIKRNSSTVTSRQSIKSRSFIDEKLNVTNIASYMYK